MICLRVQMQFLFVPIFYRYKYLPTIQKVAYNLGTTFYDTYGKNNIQNQHFLEYFS